MTAPPDPRPGRWILPLVVLGMVAFTYFFVDSLTGEENPTDSLLESTTSTTGTSPTDSVTTSSTTLPGEVTSSTSISSNTDLLDYLEDIETRIGTLNSYVLEMQAINDGFDARPRAVPYDQADQRLVSLTGNLDNWRSDLSGMEVTEGAVDTHRTVLDFATVIVQKANDALEGLRRPAPDTGEFRRESVVEFNDAVEDLKEVVTELRLTVQG